MKVFVTGGTGAIGSHAVPALIEAGHEVSALARTAEKADALTGQGARPVLVSLFDADGLTAAFRGHEAVANLASALPSTRRFMSSRAWGENNRVRIDGSASVMAAAAAAGVMRVVQESVSMVYPDCGSSWIDESVLPDRYPRATANLLAEAHARGYARATGGVAVVLRFGWFYGPRATHSEEFFALARRHICVMMGRPDTFVSSIHVRDAATAVVAAIGAPDGIYNVVDDQPLTKREYADALAAAAGKRAWLRVPGRAALLLGDRSTSLTRSLRVSNRHLRATAGWEPRHPNATDGWAATAAMLTSNHRH